MSSFRELHEELFEGATRIIGRIHKYLVTAENIYKKQRNYEPRNIYHWWIKERERNIDQLEERTKCILNLLDSLKDQMETLNNIPHFKSYKDIIQRLKLFTEEHSATMSELLSYVEFLNEKDLIVVNFLYHWDIWRSDKNDILSRSREVIPQNDIKFDRYCVEFAVGVRSGRGGGTYMYNSIEATVYGDYYDAVDLEYAGTPDFTHQIINRTGWEVMKSYSLFFSNIRKCMRRILDKIDEYWNEEYPEVILENQIKSIKDEIYKIVDEEIRIKKQFNAVLDNLLAIYASHQDIPLFETGQEVSETQFHNKVYHLLKPRLGSKIESHKKVAKGDIDFLVYNHPVDVKVEDDDQDLDKIYEKHKDQVTHYCYRRKEEAGFLFVYDNTDCHFLNISSKNIYKIET